MAHKDISKGIEKAIMKKKRVPKEMKSPKFLTYLYPIFFMQMLGLSIADISANYDWHKGWNIQFTQSGKQELILEAIILVYTGHKSIKSITDTKMSE